jgi:hypothetical protein
MLNPRLPRLRSPAVSMVRHPYFLRTDPAQDPAAHRLYASPKLAAHSLDLEGSWLSAGELPRFLHRHPAWSREPEAVIHNLRRRFLRGSRVCDLCFS